MRNLVGIVGILTVCHAAVAQSQERDWEWTGRVARGNMVEIVGINGSIRALAASGADVEVVARRGAGRRGDPEDVRIEVIEHDRGVTICAVYPGSHKGRLNTCEPGGGDQNVRDNDTKVHFTVRVPPEVHFTGRTVNGDVDAESLAGNVEVHTVNGSVQVSAAGWVEASTVNGSIHARLGRADWRGELDFETVNGTITVYLPDDVGAEVSAETVNGGIETDFPLTVQGRFNARRMRGTIGGGGDRRLTLETVNGRIRLRRANN